MDNYNYPIGADNSSAPWNQKEEKFTRFVSVTISYYDSVELKEGATEEEIREAFNEKINNGEIPSKFDIDELVILED